MGPSGNVSFNYIIQGKNIYGNINILVHTADFLVFVHFFSMNKLHATRQRKKWKAVEAKIESTVYLISINSLITMMPQQEQTEL